MKQKETKRRGIMMSTFMMQALDRGEKTETRRLSGFDILNDDPDAWELSGFHSEGDPLGRAMAQFRGPEDLLIKCRYGSKGQLLYTRETFTSFRKYPNAIKESPLSKILYPVYKAEKLDHVAKLMRWTPAIHQPANIARFNLYIKATAAERLSQVTEESAIAEGVLKNEFGFYDYFKNLYCLTTARQSYMTLLGSLHGRAIVEKNPWLWRIIFQPSKII
jgi:hypothetical protein